MYVLVAVFFAALAAYYFWHWRSVRGFVTSIDACDSIFCDFFRHYYPMGGAILETKQPVHAYFYSAFFALLLRPFAELSVTGALWAWGAVQLVCLVLLWFLPLKQLIKASPRTAALYGGLVAISLPLFHNLAWGQVSVLITVCVLASFEAYAGGRRILAGCLLAFAAAVKQYPAVFLIYFILKRDIRAIAAFGVSAIFFFALVPATALGPAEWLAFERATRSSVAWADWATLNVNSQYFANVVLRYAHGLWPHFSDRGLAATLQALGLVVAAVNVVAIWLAHRRKIRGEIALSLTSIFLALPFVVRTSWPHYFCYLPFCQIVLLGKIGNPLRSDTRGRVLSGLTLLSVAASSTFVFNALGDWNLYSKFGLLFFSNALLVAALYMICFDRNGEIVQQRAAGRPSGAGDLESL